MPELPEVQTIVNDLRKEISGEKITGFWTDWKKSIKGCQLAEFKAKLNGEKIIAIERIGKNILLRLTHQKILLVHLRMTGKLLFTRRVPNITSKTDRHTHSILLLNKNKQLEFNDIRKFGTLEIISTDTLAEKMQKIGINPLSPAFTLKKLNLSLLSKKNKAIKTLLMNQDVISGIGNIYASEILFAAKIAPQRSIGSLTAEEIAELFKNIKTILKKAVKLRGTSFSDYRDTKNKKGGFQEILKVYGKTGKKCPACGTIIEKITMGQRSTFYCPRCQK